MAKPILCVLACLLAAAGFAAEKTAPPLLQFRLVATNASAATEEVVLTTRLAGKQKEERLQVMKAAAIDGSAVKSAQDTRDNLGRPQIEITLTDSGTAQFAKLTREHRLERLAIFVDGKIQSAPVIQSEIPSGQLVITGEFSKAEAEEFAKKLNTSAKK